MELSSVNKMSWNNHWENSKKKIFNW